jgi:hypothetical protein
MAFSDDMALAGLDGVSANDLRKIIAQMLLAPEISQLAGKALPDAKVAAVRANQRRTSLGILNKSDTVTLYVGVSGQAVAGGDGFEIRPGQYWEPYRVPRNAIWLTALTECPYVVLEG